ncbi:hypothetical protein K1T73_10050 [Roseovarius sp. SCSIO 43702]|uniref:hypothetical protein n=1 Tax=Roseovarius sp. SCSIO 43702 TaxID=2823043 RepID=UPI001C72E1D2|nr:hypothetical protein [Roseovarius sp. SCSIO 43702]QYX55451.1 hypothetical protein K1T73_10050 [Roseovarius sp. SCSIO 43702]
MDDVVSMKRPELTLPEAEAGRVRAAYEEARVILEYGSGGSTVMAGEMPGKRVFSVESDEDWAAMMQGWFDANPPRSEVDVIWSDVGETKAWGYPKRADDYMKFARYPLGVWDLDEFEQPDVVLVDGRFRTGCAMATALRTARPVTLLFDDYAPRRQYHKVERLLGEPRYHGRLAEFEVRPLALDPADLLTTIEMMIRP